MIGKIILNIEKNSSKVRSWLASVILSILQIAGESGNRQRSYLLPHLCLETVFSALKLKLLPYYHYHITIFS